MCLDCNGSSSLPPYPALKLDPSSDSLSATSPYPHAPAYPPQDPELTIDNDEEFAQQDGNPVRTQDQDDGLEGVHKDQEHPELGIDNDEESPTQDHNPDRAQDQDDGLDGISKDEEPPELSIEDGNMVPSILRYVMAELKNFTGNRLFTFIVTWMGAGVLAGMKDEVKERALEWLRSIWRRREEGDDENQHIDLNGTWKNEESKLNVEDEGQETSLHGASPPDEESSLYVDDKHEEADVVAQTGLENLNEDEESSLYADDKHDEADANAQTGLENLNEDEERSLYADDHPRSEKAKIPRNEWKD